MTLVLGVESSCDETSVALLDGAGGILASMVASQVEAHERYGGVVPEIAARAHLTNLPPLLDAALARAGACLDDVSLVCATAGPGLVGALLVGLSEAKGLAVGLGVPFVPVHHIEAHCLSPFLCGRAVEPARALPDEFLALVVSGGHTHLFRFSKGKISTLARTRDDAAGEAYDKVAKMCGLGYPGGPIVDRLSSGKAPLRPFPYAVPQFKDGSHDFSYSGLKTSFRNRLLARGHEPRSGGSTHQGPPQPLPDWLIEELASFQETVVSQLEDRLEKTRARRGPFTLTVSGGVAANSLLRTRLASWGEARSVEVLLADRALTSDNAAMIAFAGLRRHLHGTSSEGLEAIARSRWPLESLPGVDPPLT